MIIESTVIGRIVVPESLPPGFALFYTTRDFNGRLSGKAAEALLAVVRDRFGISASLATCTQVHGATVRDASTPRGGAGLSDGFESNGGPWSECDSCDALWATTSATALGIKVADCVPITMLDSSHHVIANVHSGWRGAVQRITAVTLDELESETSFSTGDAFAYLGPSIRACCFEVGEEVVSEFTAAHGDVARFVDRSRSKPHIDLVGLTTELLLSRGFRLDRIVDSNLCTRCEGSIFHSFRRDGSGGRNLAVVCQ